MAATSLLRSLADRKGRTFRPLRPGELPEPPELPEPVFRDTFTGGVPDGDVAGSLRTDLPPLVPGLDAQGGAARVLPGESALLTYANQEAWRTAGWSARLVIAPTETPVDQRIAETESAGLVPGSFSFEGRNGLARGYIYDGSVHWFNGAAGGIEAASLTAGETHDVVITGGPGQGRLYLNGVLAGTAATTVGWQDMTSALNVLRWGAGGQHPWRGVLGLVEVYDTQLSASQVAAIHERDAPLPAFDAFDRSLNVEENGDATVDLFGGDALIPDGTTYTLDTSGMTLGHVTDNEDGTVTVNSTGGTGPTSFSATLSHAGREITVAVNVAVQVEVDAADAGSVAVFGHTRIDYAALAPGKTAARIESQGTYGNAYVRRAGKKATDVGRIDYYARGVNTDGGKDSFEVRNTDDTVTEVRIEVTDALPGGTLRWVDPVNGDDGNAGTQAAPWRTWEKAVTSVGANQTVILRGGVYDVPTAGLENSPSLASSNVTFRAYPPDVAAGNRPAIWTEGDRVRRYRDELNSGHWQLHHAASNTWRTVTTNHPNVKSMVGYYRNGIGGWTRLMFYGRTSEFSNALNQLMETGSGSVTNPNTTKYEGPGFVIHTDGRLYVRFDPPPSARMGPKDPRSLNPPWTWAEYMPPGGATDPNTFEVIFGHTDQPGGGFNARGVLTMTGRNNVEFRNIDFIGGGFHTVRSLSGGNGQRWYGCRWWNGACPDLRLVSNDNYSNWANCVLYDSGVFDDLLFDRCEFWGGITPWMSWWGLKGATGIPQRSCRATGFLTGVGSSTDFGQNCVIRHCQIVGFFALAQGDARPGWMFDFHHNLLRDSIIDGGLVTRRTDAPNYWIRNVGWNASFWSYTGFVNVGGGWTDQGKIFEVNNILLRTVPFQQRPFQQYGSNTAGWLVRPHEQQHGSTSEQQGHPKTRAYNTLVCTNGTNAKLGRGASAQFRPGYETSQGAQSRYFNNIAAAIPSPVAWDAPSNSTAKAEGSHAADYVAANYRPWQGSSAHIAPLYDGNHLWRAPGMPTQDGINALAVVRAGNQTAGDVACNSMSAVRTALASGGSPGQEQNGTDGDPLFVGPVEWPTPYEVGRFMLQPGSPCRTGAVNVTGQNWNSRLPGGVPPDFDGNELVPLLHRPHRGALDPDIPPLEQEIGPL